MMESVGLWRTGANSGEVRQKKFKFGELCHSMPQSVMVRQLPADIATIRLSFAVKWTPPDCGGLKLSARVSQKLNPTDHPAVKFHCV